MKKIRTVGSRIGKLFLRKFTTYFQKFPVPEFNGEFRNVFNEMIKERR